MASHIDFLLAGSSQYFTSGLTKLLTPNQKISPKEPYQTTKTLAAFLLL